MAGKKLGRLKDCTCDVCLCYYGTRNPSSICDKCSRGIHGGLDRIQYNLVKKEESDGN